MIQDYGGIRARYRLPVDFGCLGQLSHLSCLLIVGKQRPVEEVRLVVRFGPDDPMIVRCGGQNLTLGCEQLVHGYNLARRNVIEDGKRGTCRVGDEVARLDGAHQPLPIRGSSIVENEDVIVTHRAGQAVNVDLAPGCLERNRTRADRRSRARGGAAGIPGWRWLGAAVGAAHQQEQEKQ